jgi:hypothetical protein
MAAGIQQSGAQLDWAPFPDDRWHKINTWEVEGNGIVTLYRKGDALRYRFQADGINEVVDVEQDSIEQILDFFQRSTPVRYGDRIRFMASEGVISEYNSVADVTKRVTQDLWAVTMISQMGVGTDSSCLIGGHAYIIIEGINEVKEPIYFTTEICTIYEDEDGQAIHVSHNRAVPLLKPYRKFKPYWPKSDTYLRSKDLILTMIAHIQQQIDATFAEVQEGRPHLIRFNATSPVPEENIHNCLTWDLQELAICEITLPLTEPPIPGSGWYIPRYHARSIHVLCRRMIEKMQPNIEEYVPAQEIEEFREKEQEISRIRESISPAGIGECLLKGCYEIGKENPIGFFIGIPLFLSVMTVAIPVIIGVEKYRIHKRESALNKRKVEHLKILYNG